MARIAMMQWLNNLIWVGNTLYPRWFVFAAIGAVIVLLVVLGIGLRGYTDSPTLAGKLFSLAVAVSAGVILVTLALLHI